jgi:copper(I)-binding protein
LAASLAPMTMWIWVEKMLRRLAIIVVLLLTVGPVPPAECHDFQAGALAVDRAHTGPSVVGQREDPAFMTITNYGEDDVLVGLTCAVADSVELRAAVPAEVGTKTRSLNSIPIPANSTLEFKPQGYYVAFVGLNYSFALGERIATTLKFGSGVELPVEFQVEAAADVAGQ